ncbi:MAG TPA: LuxR C-terminal-related transcriptional regulator [Arthrobacter sp.]|jgi:DNA-binding NarL/FixJ family response regulator|nr:LuxR C-terminal-related transcriptional regulator [Arthrobacter sp.]
MDGFDELLATARTAYARGDWHAAHRQLTQAGTLSELATADLSLLGGAAWWLGRVKESLEISEEVYHRFQDDGDAPGAAMKALNLGLLWFIRGDLVIASGWVNRARRILQDLPEGREHGYLLYLDAGLRPGFPDLGPTRETAATLQDLGRRLRAPALTSFGLVLSGLADVRSGSTASGFAQLDEAMLPVLAGQLPGRGGTRHRAERGGARGPEQLGRGRGLLPVGRNPPAARGQRRCRESLCTGARAGDRAAARRVTAPAGGREERRLGRSGAALAGRDRLACARLLESGVEIALALGHLDEAERLCGQLEETAAVFATAGFRAWAGQARAAVLITQSRHAEALPVLQAAAREYRGLHARYETARIYELLAQAHRGLALPNVAAADSATALAIYRELGALPDVQRLDGRRLPGGLTEREADVLALTAGGASNKDTAAALFISQKTVGRHLANIFAKIGVTSRTAAAAWAHENGLHPRR